MSNRVRVIMALNEGVPEVVRCSIGDALESAGWIPTGDNEDCWLCRAREDEIGQIERRVRKAIEFAAFTAEIEGRLSFALKVGTGEPQNCAVRIGSGGLKTKPIPEKSRGLDFATKSVSGRPSNLPGDTNCPSVTQLKTAF